MYQLILRINKGKIVHIINLAPCHEGIGVSGGIALPFLTSVLDGGE
jgi:hypothetical protein